MKKLFCLFAFIFALTPSFAQNEENRDSVTISKFFKELQAQRVTEICGVKFGTSYEDAKRILENKYGEAEYDYKHSKESLTFANKTYAGISFDTILFLFQSDGYRTYMNGCVFAIDSNTAEDAKEKRELLYNRLSGKYYMDDSIDKNGFKYYIGGFSPINENDAAFSIDIVKYDADVAKKYNPYAARLMYGRYNYVKEEF